MAELLVCAKLVYDLENVLSSEWRLSEDAQSIPIESAGKIMNVCDANALELALRLKERLPQGEARITVLTAGGEACRKMLANARAVGADRCVRIPAPEEPDHEPGRTAALLCAGIRRLGPFDLLLFGASAGEYDMGQTGLLAAERLGCPVLPEAIGVEARAGGGFRIRHLLDEGVGETEVAGPVAVTVGTAPEVCLRSPTLKAVLAAAKCPEEVLEAAPEAVPPRGKVQDWLRIPDDRKTCAFLDPERPEDAAALVRALLEGGGDTP